MPLLGRVGLERRLKRCCLAERMVSGRRPYERKVISERERMKRPENQICWHGRRWRYWSGNNCRGSHCPQHTPPHVHRSVLLEDTETVSLAFGCFLPLRYIPGSASVLPRPRQKQITSSGSKIQVSDYSTERLQQGKKTSQEYLSTIFELKMNIV